MFSKSDNAFAEGEIFVEAERNESREISDANSRPAANVKNIPFFIFFTEKWKCMPGRAGVFSFLSHAYFFCKAIHLDHT